MKGGSFASPVRKGDTVERQAGAGSLNVHALLLHFESKGFELTPRFLGVTAGGEREIVSFIEGETAYPPFATSVREVATLENVARAIREMHDAAADFTPKDHAAWHSHEVALPVAADCIGHRDLGPWNFIFAGTDVVGIIDWDFAGPSSRAWDLAYAAHHFVPFHPTEDLIGWGWEYEPDRSDRLKRFVDAYGMNVSPAEIVDLAIVRMTAIAAHIEAQGRLNNPAFDLHKTDDHASGYRAAAQYIIGARSQLLA